MANIAAPDRDILDYINQFISKTAYIGRTKRVYERENKKFVPIGWKVAIYDPHTGKSLPTIVILDVHLP